MKTQRRETRRQAKEQFAKVARAVWREQQDLWNAKWNTELIPLEQPYQRGWVRWYDWSKEAHRHPDFDKFEYLIKLFQNKQWSQFHDFRRVKRCRRKRKKNERIYDNWSPKLGWHPKDLLRRTKDRFLYRYFVMQGNRTIRNTQHLRSIIQSGWGGRIYFCYPSFLTAKIEPYYITHQKLIIPELDSRLAEIDDWIDQHGGSKVIHRIMNGKSNWWDRHDRQKIRDRECIMEVREELEERGFIRAFRFIVRSPTLCLVPFGDT